MKKFLYLSRVAALSTVIGLIFSTSVFALPPTLNNNGIDYVTGGIGLDESTEIEAAQRQWPLTLQFAAANRTGGEFVADVNVSISDSRGREVMTAVADGPYLLVKLPPGRYNVNATYNGVMMKKSVTIQQGKPVKASMLWRAS